ALSMATGGAQERGREQELAPAPREVPMAAALQDALDRWAALPGHLGVSASVVLADGAQWTGTAGRAGIDEPLRADHLVQIASITKTMTAAVILLLVDEGVLRLDDPLSRWLPDRPNIDGAITLRQLLHHTAGLANYTGSAGLRGAINTDRTHVFTPDELLAFVGPPVAAPGERTFYTNTAFVLLGQVAEHATDRPILDLYRQRLWAPLALSESFLPGFEDPTGPVAAAQDGAGFVSPLDEMAVLSAGHSAFGLLATAREVARWGRALFTGTVISDEMQEAMRELVPAAGNIPGERGAGLGIRSYDYFDRVQYGHSGGGSFGSSLLLFDPNTGITVVVIMNQGQGAQHFVLAPRLLQLATP
ncbi:MAG TPA: serine hydrolase domain-containing protein, partial [Vicinamibacterales bacterium]|nr:serine hydrolase domain-containing protein [Vicinamibacterales bacterium]